MKEKMPFHCWQLQGLGPSTASLREVDVVHVTEASAKDFLAVATATDVIRVSEEPKGAPMLDVRVHSCTHSPTKARHAQMDPN